MFITKGKLRKTEKRLTNKIYNLKYNILDRLTELTRTMSQNYVQFSQFEKILGEFEKLKEIVKEKENEVDSIRKEFESLKTSYDIIGKDLIRLMEDNEDQYKINDQLIGHVATLITKQNEFSRELTLLNKTVESANELTLMVVEAVSEYKELDNNTLNQIKNTRRN